MNLSKKDNKFFNSQLLTLTHALDNAADAILITDNNGAIVFVNQGFTLVTGYTWEDAIGKNPKILKSGKVSADTYKKMWKSVLNGEVWKGELVSKKKNGKLFDAELVVSPVIGEDGEILNIIGVQRDITKRKNMEKKLMKKSLKLKKVVNKLAKSKKAYKTLIERANDGIVRIDENGKISIWNNEAETIFGFTYDEMIGESIYRILPEKYQERHKILIEAIVKGKKAMSGGKTVEFEGLKKNGTIFPIEMSMSFEKNKTGFYFLAIIRDITKRKFMEQQLLQSEKLQSIGHLAAGVAHEVNNPLSIMEIDLSMIEEYGQHDVNTMESIKSLRDQLRRIASIVRVLQDISRPSNSPKEKIEIQSIFNGHMMNIAFKELKKNNIDVTLSLKTDNAIVEASKGQLIQVFLNMIKNSEDAIFEKDEIIKKSMEGKAKFKKELKISTKYINDNTKVLIEFEDTGIGIDENMKKHIFDPFFTTKGSKGTGLGLPISYNIIKSFGGNIKIESNHLQGSTFKIFLPLKLNQKNMENVC